MSAAEHERPDEELYEKEFFLRSRLLHLWLEEQIKILLAQQHGVETAAELAGDADELRFIKHAARMALSFPLFLPRRNHVEHALKALLAATATYCPSWETANNAQKRLFKRPANFFAGWLGRIIRTPSQRPFYAALHQTYTELARATGAQPLATDVGDVFAHLHGAKDEDETGFLRRAFLEMTDMLMVEIRDRGGGAYLLACISSCERPEELPGVLGVAMRLTRHTVAAGFVAMASNEAEHRKARKSYESVPWKAMGTVASITGPRLSAAIIDLVLGVSTGGHTLFDRLLLWSVSIDDTQAALAHMRRRLAGNSYGDVVRKLDALVAEFYPMTSARPQLCDRSVLDDLLVCNLVQPPLEPALVDSMSEDDFADAYAYAMLRLEWEDKMRLRAELASSQPAIDFLSELVHAVRAGIKELVLTGDVAVLIKSLAAALRPVLGGPVDCATEEWAARSEQAAADLVNSIYSFARKSIMRSAPIRDTVVWVVEALSPFPDDLDFGGLCRLLADDAGRAMDIDIAADIDRMVKHHKYSSTRRKQMASVDYEHLPRLVPPFERWLWAAIHGHAV